MTGIAARMTMTLIEVIAVRYGEATADFVAIQLEYQSQVKAN